MILRFSKTLSFLPNGIPLSKWLRRSWKDDVDIHSCIKAARALVLASYFVAPPIKISSPLPP